MMVYNIFPHLKYSLSPLNIDHRPSTNDFLSIGECLKTAIPRQQYGGGIRMFACLPPFLKGGGEDFI